MIEAADSAVCPRIADRVIEKPQEKILKIFTGNLPARLRTYCSSL